MSSLHHLKTPPNQKKQSYLNHYPRNNRSLETYNPIIIGEKQSTGS